MIASVTDEIIVLGYAVDHRESLDRLLAEVTEEHFTEVETKAMYNGILKIIEQGAKLDFRTLGNFIKDKDTVQEALLKRARSLSPDPHFKALHECYQRRGYNMLAQQLSRLTSIETFDLSLAEQMVTDYMPGNPMESAKKHFIEMDEAVDTALAELDEAMKHPGQINGLSLAYTLPNGASSGFKGLDATLMGLQGGDAIMFSAQSGHGKTALAMNLTRILSYHNKKRVHYLNTEMSIAQMMRRWISQSTLIPYTRLELGEVQNYERDNVQKWADEFRKTPLTVSQISSLNIGLTVGIAKRAIKKYGKLDCLIVDYIGRMDIEHGKGMQEWQIMYENTKKLKELARDLNIPIIILAQLTQEGNLEGAKKMRNELDGLFFLKPKRVGEEGEGRDKRPVFSDSEFYLTKEKVRRNGTKDVIHLEFEKEFQLIREV